MLGWTAASRRAVAAVRRIAVVWPILLGISPPILLIAWINRYAINVPFGDEWALVPLFEKWSNGQLTFRDLYQQHNEHRIPIPKLIYLAFAELTNWNLRAEMFLSVGLCGVTSACVYVLLRRTVGESRREAVLLWAAANLLIFSPMQAQNWLWGFQLQMFIPTLCLVMTLVIFTSDFASWAKFGGSGLLVALATFSFGNGLLLWPVVALFLILRGESKWWVAAWLLASAVVLVLYSVGYYRIPRLEPVTRNWFDYPRYFLVFIGAALARGRDGQLLLGAMITGGVALCVYAAMVVRSCSSRAEALRSAAPWLALGPYVIGSAALAAYSRADWGPQQALDSRYVTISHVLYLGLIALTAVAARHATQAQERMAATMSGVKTISITTVVALAVAAYPAGLEDMATLHREQLRGLGALQFAEVIDTTESMRRDLRMVPGFVPTPLQHIKVLQRLELLGYAPHGSAVLEERPARRTESASKHGRVDAFSQSDPQNIEISGWAVLPGSAHPAPLVVLAYRERGQWIAFAVCEVSEWRTDVVARLRSRDYLASGWRKTFARQSLPASAETISAWAVDPLANRVHKLRGEHPLPKL